MMSAQGRRAPQTALVLVALILAGGCGEGTERNLKPTHSHREEPDLQASKTRIATEGQTKSAPVDLDDLAEAVRLVARGIAQEMESSPENFAEGIRQLALQSPDEMRQEALKLARLARRVYTNDRDVIDPCKTLVGRADGMLRGLELKRSECAKIKRLIDERTAEETRSAAAREILTSVDGYVNQVSLVEQNLRHFCDLVREMEKTMDEGVTQTERLEAGTSDLATRSATIAERYIELSAAVERDLKRLPELRVAVSDARNEGVILATQMVEAEAKLGKAINAFAER